MAELTRIPINWHINVPGKRDFTLCSGPNCRCRCNPEQASLKVAARVETFAQQHALDATTLAGYSGSMKGVLLADPDLAEAYLPQRSGPRVVGAEIDEVVRAHAGRTGKSYSLALHDVMRLLAEQHPEWLAEYAFPSEEGKRT